MKLLAKTPRRALALMGLAALTVVTASPATAAPPAAPGSRAFADPGAAGVPKRGKAPKTVFTFDSQIPESSPWAAIPTSDDINACLPDVTTPPAEKVIAHCVVGGQGALEDCQLGKPKDTRMKGWAACILPKFKAKANYRGRNVEVPIQFTEEIAKQ